MKLFSVVLFMSILLITGLRAQEDAATAKTLAELQPKLANVPVGKHEVGALLRDLEKQTGNRVVDRRAAAATRSVEIGFDKQPFLSALDKLATALDANVSPYTEDGLALVDRAAKKGPIAYAGICRFEIRSVDVNWDAATERRTCVAQVEVVWEPRFEPLYATMDQIVGEFAPDETGRPLAINEKSRVPQSTARVSALMLELRFPAPGRGSPKIAKLGGTLRFLGPAKMLDFAFPLGAKIALEQEGVQVTLEPVIAKKEFWRLDLTILNPAGTPFFESYQSWLENNRLHLKNAEPGPLVVWKHRPEDQQFLSDPSPRRAAVRYEFAGAQNKGVPGNWILYYRTPGRIVELTIPFEFRDVPLP